MCFCGTKKRKRLPLNRGFGISRVSGDDCFKVRIADMLCIVQVKTMEQDEVIAPGESVVPGQAAA